MVRSNFPSSVVCFLGSGRDAGVFAASAEELEEAYEEFEPGELSRGLAVLSPDGFSLFAVVLPLSGVGEPLRSLMSTQTLEEPLSLLLCRELVLRGGAGGCLIFVTERLRIQFLFFAWSPPAPEQDPADSEPSSISVVSLLPLGLVIALSELWRLEPSWSPICISCPLRSTLCEVKLIVLTLDVNGEESEITVLEESLQWEPEADVGMAV